MSSGLLSPPFAPPIPLAPPSVVKRPYWTVDEFHRIGDTGVLEGRNAILIDGEILEMPSAGGPHDTALTLLDDSMRTIFSSRFVIRCRMSLVLGKSLDPVPDLAVV